MAGRPVFVVHGISNRDPSVLEERVAALREAALGRWDLHPTFWGDLGAAHLGVDLVMPPSARGGPVVRDSAEGLAVVLEAVDDQEAREAIAEGWEETRWLSRTEDPAVLAEVGAVLAAAVAASSPDGYVVREPGRIRRLIGERLPELDRVAGAAIGSAGERFYTWFRTRHAEYVAKTLGDILVYQRHGEQIRARIRSQIEAAVPGAGRSPETAVHLVGHSLGAVIALDLATAVDEPVWVSGLVTFGCQWPLIHVVDPRAGVEAYQGSPVSLPPTVGRWTNLWHPLDPLGFVAGRIFSGVEDIRVDYLFSEELYAHSVYWTRPELVAAMSQTFTRRP
ncbi:hypothetical protein FB565_006642 [Actinoplanes lutulentus]|uniref:Alpha/beta hydrolase family protein n=1 Tax=Actinoplanes lutulentus TaxID=1287878 RepID=A0A327ZBP8_9ACTN|nr:hypothetical protein [Actinoplanes lutulentus]MBB2946874.1 hypothetical protein [Actinoplanes lutulentus]RAK35768.1 hypothetical protein B0I29_109242 [Actinoplanes lutulentus]